MNRLNIFLENKIAPIASKFGSQRHLLAIRNGMVLAMPLIIIGSFPVMISSLPFPHWAEWLANHGDLGTWLGKISNGSFGLMGIVAVFGIAYNLATSYKLDGVSAGILSLSSFIILSPNVSDVDGIAGLPYKYMGSGGLFVAILVALLSTEIFRYFIEKDITIKMPDSVPPAVSKSFVAIIPGCVILFFWAAIYKIIDLAGLISLHDVIQMVLGKPLSILGGSLIGTCIAVAVTSIFWLCGIHGADTVGAVMYPIWYAAMDANRVAFEAGQAIPNIVTYPFLMNFVYPGGGGATLALAVTIVLFGKSKQSKAMGRLGFAPSIFNINEPLMFGLPIVLNPTLFIPYVLAPVANVIIAYLAMSSGLVARTSGVNPSWTMPIIISGLMSTGWKISGAVLQIVILVVDILIYYPFFKMFDKQELQRENTEM